jgi:hypothetical protein
VLLLAVFLSAGPGGCAAMTNPVMNGVPVHRLPPELLAPSKACEQTICLTLLRQPPPDAYRLEPGDVLGVYVEGYLGDRNVALPLHVAPLVRIREQQNLPPASGYPVTVQEDGTVSLPAVSPVPVRGLTIPEARAAVRDQYLKEKRLRPETERVLVSLLYPRRSQVLVFRQETPLFVGAAEGPIAASKRGTGSLLDLPAYENDVLHALALTGGLPALDVYDEVIIFRDCFRDAEGGALLQQQLQAGGPAALPPLCPHAGVVHIPLRTPAGQPPPVRPEDAVLHNGDVVFLEARNTDLYYTGGILPPAVHVLPRDRDLDVVQAVLEVRGPLFNGAFGGSNLSGDLIKPGIGDPSPSLLTVLRRVPDGRQVAISVDLRKAARDPQENLIVKAGDILILQEAPGEALARYFSQTFFNFDIFWQAFRSSNLAGVVDVAAPERLGQRPAIVNFNHQ